MKLDLKTWVFEVGLLLELIYRVIIPEVLYAFMFRYYKNKSLSYAFNKPEGTKLKKYAEKMLYWIKKLRDNDKRIEELISYFEDRYKWFW